MGLIIYALTALERETIMHRQQGVIYNWFSRPQVVLQILAILRTIEVTVRASDKNYCLFTV